LTVFPNPNSGRIVRDQDAGRYNYEVGQDVSGFIQARLEGHRREWIAERYSITLDSEPNKLVDILLDITDAQVVEDIMLYHRHYLALVQCPYCGRLWVQEEPGVNKYLSFKPEGEWKRVLMVHEIEE
jgi:hypothetical protein